MGKALILVLLLAGCTPKHINVPVPVACVDAKDVPVRPRPLKETPIPGSLEAASAILLGKVAEWTAYGEKAAPIMAACSR